MGRLGCWSREILYGLTLPPELISLDVMTWPQELVSLDNLTWPLELI